MYTPESVKKYMAKNPVTFRPNQPIHDVIRVMVRKGISGAPVVNNEGALVGMISEKDCLQVIVDSAYNNLPAGKVSDYMSYSVESVSDKTNLVEIANKFLNTHFKRFPILNSEGKLLGQISRSDVLRAIKDMRATTWQEVIERVENDHTVVKQNFKDAIKH